MRLRAADLFCGAGGTSAGAEATGEASVVFALNHWATAVKTHQANFPHCRHVNSRLEDVQPSESEKINLLFASPECTHHSKARGGKPTSDQQRAGAWYVLPWIEYHRPSWIVIENVTEFKEWGPVDTKGKPIRSLKGKFFDAWLMAIRAAGYRLDYQELNAANFGAATSRNRLFIVARLGNRNPVFPEPTHGKNAGGELPGLGVSPWRAASEIIDWNIPCPSVFRRPRPLADKTLLRIEAGLRRFVAPFVAQWDNQTGGGAYVRSVNGPLATMTTKASMGIAVPFQVILRNHMDSAELSSPLNTITAGGGHHGVALPFMADVNHGESGHFSGRTHDLGSPLGTVTAHNGKAVCVPFVMPRQGFYDCHKLKRSRDISEPLPTITASHVPGAVVTPFIVPNFGESPRQPPRSHAIQSPAPCVTSHGAGCLAVPFQYQLIGRGAGNSRSVHSPIPTIIAARENHGVVLPWISHYYGTQNQSPVTEPLDTITTKERHSLCVAMCRGPEDWPVADSEAMRKLQSTMRELGVCDIGFRMLQNPELSAAQGFRPDYIFHGVKSDVTRQIGNSVSPAVAQAITQAILSV